MPKIIEVFNLKNESDISKSKTSTSYYLIHGHLLLAIEDIYKIIKIKPTLEKLKETLDQLISLQAKNKMGYGSS